VWGVLKKLFFLKTTTADAQYDWRTNLLSDVLAGLATSTMLVPQSISYALLVGIPPIYGLYTAFFPGLIYLVRSLRVCVRACVRALRVYESV
jgi:MFS superfamily sulfate permease-like transporter